MNSNKQFETYFKRYYTALGMYVTRICRDAQEAEDIVQETYSIAWEKFAGLPLPDSYGSFAFLPLLLICLQLSLLLLLSGCGLTYAFQNVFS